MKPWQSVSTRLTLTLLSVTFVSLTGLSLILDTALKRFFIQDAQTSLQQQANALATQARSQWKNSPIISQLADLTSQQGQVQVIIFNSNRIARVKSQGIQNSSQVELPPLLIPKTLAGMPQAGQFWVATDAHYPWWLYSTAGIRDAANAQVIGAVYVAMPLRRPKQFAQQVKGLVMAMALAAATVATAAGLLVSRTLTSPLQRLHQQTQRLEAGDYTARSELKGQDELAQLSRLLDQMATKLTQTLAALQAQETARRELVANVSHDLRTPLSTLRVGLEAVLDGVVEGAKAQQYLKRACRETDYLAHLVEQLLLLAKADAGELRVRPQAVSAVAIAQECLFRMQPSATQADLKLELCAAPHLARVWVDPELTGQVVLNLLDNAIKYAADGKVIRLQILPQVEKDQHQYIPLQVQDQGRGMVRDVVERVTERFYRGDGIRPRGGLGLGLAIAQNVCQLQGGTLQIDSQLEQGTVVTLFLPVAIS
jgi:signal transduction histidine kinase